MQLEIFSLHLPLPRSSHIHATTSWHGSWALVSSPSSPSALWACLRLSHLHDFSTQAVYSTENIINYSPSSPASSPPSLQSSLGGTKGPSLVSSPKTDYLYHDWDCLWLYLSFTFHCILFVHMGLLYTQTKANTEHSAHPKCSINIRLVGWRISLDNPSPIIPRHQTAWTSRSEQSSDPLVCGTNTGNK